MIQGTCQSTGRQSSGNCQTQQKKNFQNDDRDLWGNIRDTNIHNYRGPQKGEERKKGAENLLK